jgi:hypothetical protein
MDIGSIFLILGLLILVAIFVGRPLLENKTTAVTQEEHEFSALLAERDRVINALQELDFDFALGKIPEADYPLQRAVLLRQGADILRKLDALQPAQATESDLEARIEAAIAARKAEAARPQPAPNGGKVALATADDDLEALIASRRRERHEKAAGFCSQCGQPLQKSDRFCPKCGTVVV